MERDASSVSMTPEQVARLVDRGVAADDVVRLLVATGSWSEAGAAEIVSTLTQRPVASGLDPLSTDFAWPGPLEEVPPLFAT